MVIKSNDRLISSYHIKPCKLFLLLYFVLKLLMLTTSALRDYVYAACRFQFLYSLISDRHTIRISYKEIILTQKANYSSFELVILCNPRLSVIRRTFKTGV